jgi:hypothetical protein
MKKEAILSEPVYIVGIDLGTTNSVVSYTEANIEKGKKPNIRILDIPQLVSPGTVEKRQILPSFILVPGKHDVAPDALALPWNNEMNIAVGEFARERGTEIPHRLISSSKSWLCHVMVDRNKPILPYEGPDDVQKMSPVEAAAAILHHIRDSWNYLMAADNDMLKLEHQDVLITVPASFDAVARELTVRAAEIAGLSHITLLEEPQAAFYAWIESAGETWREKVKKGDLVLVCDIGGGTSDFSLISVSESEGDLALERVSVGDHLLMGGDNMDLALAYITSRKISPKGKKPDPWQMRSLWHICRKAKEKLFSEQELDEYQVTVLGRGSSLIGGTKKTKLTRKEVESVILDGFFPHCAQDAKPMSNRQTGIRELGLSYESDPAITRHLAHFLNRQENPHLPTAILFNGGVMKAASLQKRVMEVISSWAKAEGAVEIRDIHSDDLDLSVAKGSVYYGLARRGKGIRIRGGLNKTYYIGVAASLPAVPGMPVPIRALCVAPFGMEEGTQTILSEQEFILVVGEAVKFDFLGSSARLEDKVGTIVDNWEEEIEEITTMETTLDGPAGTIIPVLLEIRVTEIGTLEIWCVSKQNGKRWKLEFNVRERE